MEQINKIKTDWKEIILAYPDLEKLLQNLKKEEQIFEGNFDIYPPKDLIFECFNYFNACDTKVLILGQDPYHGKGQACGLCFAVNENTTVPRSLNNIRNELVLNLGIDLKSVNLQYWAEQKILLLNSALTVLSKCPGSFLKLWLPFTKYIIETLNQQENSIVFVAWGAFAHKQLSKIDQTKHHLLVSSHPSPLSAYKPYKQFPPFKGSKVFEKINSLLKDKIYW